MSESLKVKSIEKQEPKRMDLPAGETATVSSVWKHKEVD